MDIQALVEKLESASLAKEDEPDSNTESNSKVADESPNKVADVEEEEEFEGDGEPPNNILREEGTIIDVRVNGVEASALYSAASWEDLDLSEELLKGVYAKGFVRPAKIQAISLPLICNRLNPESIIAQAQNGSGKTATFTLSLLWAVDPTVREPQGLCLSPTRELAGQNLAVLEELGKFTGVTTFAAVSQCEKFDQSKSAQIVMGTPGKTKDLIQRRQLPVHQVKMFVLDEADVMMDQRNNMGQQVTTIRKSCKPSVQVLLFSATFPEVVRTFCERQIPTANTIKVKKEDLSLKTIQQFYHESESNEDKLKTLQELYYVMIIGQSVVFANSKEAVKKLASNLTDQGFTVSTIHGDLSVDEREKVMEQFRAGYSKVLVATDIISRGIDNPEVRMVVNFDLPLVRGGGRRNIETETYLHRIGRTGRFGMLGMSVSLVNASEQRLLDQVREFYGCTIEKLDILDTEKLEKMVEGLRKPRIRI